MADLRFDLGSFASTEITVSAVSQNGRDFLASFFGAGAVSITLPKSKGDDLARFVQDKGLSIC